MTDRPTDPTLPAQTRPAMPRPAEPPGEDRYHYRVIERALRAMEEPGAPAGLNALAARIGLSPAHFQRVFSEWVGISPKRYQQYLSLDLARQLLAERHTMLDTAAAAGLSGGGRLHDLFLRWEAMSPGEFARAGDGLDIRHGTFDSPFGPAVVAGTRRGICGIAFAAETGTEAALADLARRWPDARLREAPEALAHWVEPIFDTGASATPSTGSPTEPVPLQLVGAPFHIKVWEALLRIPSGQVTTYGDIARHIGNPKANRAVGAAVGRNPIGFLIPCHRAIARSGALTGYHWGIGVKRAMLGWEAARTEAAQNAPQPDDPLTGAVSAM